MKSHGKLSGGLFGLALFAALFFVASGVLAKEGPNGKKSQIVNKVAGTPGSSLFNINNITAWMQDDALYPPNVGGSWIGEYPRGSGVGFIFQEGIVFGGFVNDGGTPALRVGGTTYPTGMVPGAITGTGVAEDPAGPTVRIWRVRPDVFPNQDPKKVPDLSTDAATFYQVPNASVTAAQISAIQTQYVTDWNQWPAAKGAPWYIDSIGVVRNDAAYDPTNPHDWPGIPGASQTIWFVCNDLNPGVTSVLYGAPPIGIEEQQTIWGYASSTPLNEMYFKQVKLIYKGTATSNVGSTIDSMYVVQWRDPDNGDAGDDYAGCDSTLSLGFCYNGEPIDAKYAAIGLPPAASGSVFLQGPSHFTGNDADSAVLNFQWRHGYAYWHPVAMTGYDYFAAGTNITDPDLGAYGGTEQFFNLMRGDLPRPQYPAGTPFYSASTYASAHGIVTNYMLSGDPVTHAGWVDGYDVNASDRRDLNVSGPFTLKLYDTVEVVVGMVGGLGKSATSSVSVLKYNTTFAHFAFNNLFHLPVPPPTPNVAATALNDTVLLNWATDEENINSIETSASSGFTFEGYNVYQLPNASAKPTDGVRIATFDLKDGVTTVLDNAIDATTGVVITKPDEFGTDSGIQRFVSISADALRGDAPLVNGQVYYYAITSYSVDLDPSAPLHALESAPSYKTVIPHGTNPGQRYGTPGDTVKVTHVGPSNGSVTPVIVDPTVTTGDNYQVTFQTDPTTQTTTWTLSNVTGTAKVLLTGQTNQSGDNNYLVTDGLQVIVQGPPPGMSTYNIPGGVRDWTFSGASSYGLEGFSGAIGMAYNEWFSSSTILPSQLHKVVIKFATTDASANIANLSDPNVSQAYRYLRHASAAAVDPAFAPFIINPVPGYPYQDRRPVPFAAFDEDNNNQRLDVGFLENNAAGGTVDGKYDPPLYTAGIDNVATTREWFFIFGTNYDANVDNPALTHDILDTTVAIMWWGTPNMRNPHFTAGDEFEIVPNYVNTSTDVFSFKAPAVTSSQTAAKSDVQLVNVFPNPYYGFQYRETNALNKQVTFNHLPAKATIRIFNLAGVLVRTIEKNDASQFSSWDLRNSSDLPVASGIYIIYVDMGNLGTKILKLALVQQEQVLPTY
ncbi:MAG TPA: T9SS type A sorting domain-containing protein [Candidatus Kryptonia bacterium]